MTVVFNPEIYLGNGEWQPLDATWQSLRGACGLRQRVAVTMCADIGASLPSQA